LGIERHLLGIERHQIIWDRNSEDCLKPSVTRTLEPTSSFHMLLLIYWWVSFRCLKTTPFPLVSRIGNAHNWCAWCALWKALYQFLHTTGFVTSDANYAIVLSLKEYENTRQNRIPCERQFVSAS